MLDPHQLLRRLEPAVRRGGPSPAIRPVPGIAEAGFGELLTMVASGRLRSDRAVLVSPDAAIQPPLQERQLERLAAAADEAEAAGARRAIMLIDGRGIVMDVGDRRVDREATPGTPPLVDIDAAVAVPADPAEAADRADAAGTNGGSAAEGAPPAGADTAATPPPAVVGRIGRPLGPPSALPAHVARAIPHLGMPLADTSRGPARAPG